MDNKALLSVAIAALFLSSLSVELFARPTNLNDRGYIFCGPREVFNSKRLKKDLIIKAYTRHGVVITTNENSPWFDASVFAHGSMVVDTSGTIIKEVTFYETADKNGNLCWSVLWLPDGQMTEAGTLEIIQGMGLYAGISGSGEVLGEAAVRADGYQKLPYDIYWQIDPSDPPFSDEIENKQAYEYMDKCLSFHGPHKLLFSKEYTNGLSLEFSTQSGVLMSQKSSDMKSPRNNATCFDRGNTIKLHGKTQGDVMLLEDTDEHGDVVWLYHIWWYNKGPGIYKFIGGLGKWEGIDGVGVTKGMYLKRTDDHYMLKSELYWNLPR